MNLTPAALKRSSSKQKSYKSYHLQTIYASFIILRYIYSHNFSVKNLQKAEMLLKIGSKYEVACIEDDCETFLMKRLKDFVISDVLEFAQRFKMEELSKLCSVVCKLRKLLKQKTSPKTFCTYLTVFV